MVNRKSAPELHRGVRPWFTSRAGSRSMTDQYLRLLVKDKSARERAASRAGVVRVEEGPCLVSQHLHKVGLHFRQGGQNSL